MVCVTDWTGQICIKHRHGRTRLSRYFVTVCCITTTVFYNPGFSSCLLVLECVIIVSPSLTLYFCLCSCSLCMYPCDLSELVKCMYLKIPAYCKCMNKWESFFKGKQGKEQTYSTYSAVKNDQPLPDLLGFAHFHT